MRTDLGNASSVAAKPVEVDGHVRRQLQKDRSEVRAQLACTFHQERHRLLRLAKPPDVGQVAARLDGEDETLGHARRPGAERRAGRHPVERDVELDRVEPRGVELELRAARGRWIEPAAPMLVQEPGRAEVDGRGSLPVSGSSRGCSALSGPRPCGSAIRSPRSSSSLAIEDLARLREHLALLFLDVVLDVLLHHDRLGAPASRR